jgi:glycerol-3-phosphate cytidylyltransferase
LSTNNRVVGFTASAFDLLHGGHILMLQEAKTICDYLIVALQVDPSREREHKNKPSQSLIERQIQLKATKYVDEIIVYETEEDLVEILKSIPMNVRIIGEDYLGKDFTGKQYCMDNGIEIYYNRRKHDYSSSGLVNKIRNVR